MLRARWAPRTIGAVGPLALACLVLAGGCKRRHVPVEAVPELGYPACGDGGAHETGSAIAAAGYLRSGPFSNEKNVTERFELRRTACGFVFDSRQEWPLAISDVEVRYDEQRTPVWAWKRMTIAGSTRADGNADIRRYELRTGDVFIKHRDARGAVTLEKLLAGGRMTVPEGARVAAVVGPGRGILSAWLQRSALAVGEKRHDLVLDFREMFESVEMAALERNPDLYEPSLGRTVRAYTFFGRETVFADEHDVVIGDLAGLRPSDTLTTPEPEPLPTFGGADPMNTP